MAVIIVHGNSGANVYLMAVRVKVKAFLTTGDLMSAWVK